MKTTIESIRITPKGEILLALTEVGLDFIEAKELLSEFGEVMGSGIFHALLEIKTAKEAAELILDWKKDN